MMTVHNRPSHFSYQSLVLFSVLIAMVLPLKAQNRLDFGPGDIWAIAQNSRLGAHLVRLDTKGVPTGQIIDVPRTMEELAFDKYRNALLYSRRSLDDGYGLWSVDIEGNQTRIFSSRERVVNFAPDDRGNVFMWGQTALGFRVLLPDGSSIPLGGAPFNWGLGTDAMYFHEESNAIFIAGRASNVICGGSNDFVTCVIKLPLNEERTAVNGDPSFFTIDISPGASEVAAFLGKGRGTQEIALAVDTNSNGVEPRLLTFNANMRSEPVPWTANGGYRGAGLLGSGILLSSSKKFLLFDLHPGEDEYTPPPPCKGLAAEGNVVRTFPEKTDCPQSGNDILLTGSRIVDVVEIDEFGDRKFPPVYEVNVFHHLPRVKGFESPTLIWNGLTNEQNPDPIKVFADGSSATRITLNSLTTEASNSSVSLIIGVSNRNDLVPISCSETLSVICGSIKRDNRAESPTFEYTHPTVVGSETTREIYLYVINQDSEEILSVIPIQTFKPPVLFIHGLWSDAGAFLPIKQYIDAILWPPGHEGQYSHSANYDEKLPSGFNRNESSFAINTPLVGRWINQLIKQVLSLKISGGKVSIVGHSMGGILARLYMQDDSLYQNNVFNLITINTPHSGTQIANHIRDLFPSTTPYVVSTLVGKLDGGAVDDLKVDSSGIMDLNSSLPIQSVPVHAIHSSASPGDEFLYLGLYSLAGLQLPPKEIIDIPGQPPVKIYYNASEFSSLMWRGEETDLIVPRQSQLGGIADNAQTGFEGISHTYILEENIEVFEEIYLLLNNDGIKQYTSQGFNPPTLTYTPISVDDGASKTRNRIVRNITDSTYIITPADQTVFTAGTSIPIEVQTDLVNPRTVLFLKTRTNTQSYKVLDESSIVTDLDIPETAIGPSILYAFSITDSTTSVDSVLVNIISGDEITGVYGLNSNAVLMKGDQTYNPLIGQFESGIERDITLLPKVSYRSVDNSVATINGSGTITGIGEGETQIVAEIEGLTESFNVQVIENTRYATLPAVPELIYPVGLETGQRTDFNFEWESSTQTTAYQYQLSNTANFSSTIVDTSLIGASSFQLESTLLLGTYYWRVRGLNEIGTSEWSQSAELSIVEGVNYEKINDIGSFSLHPGFPNPFTTTTTITIQTPHATFLTVTIYDSLGRKVDNIIDTLFTAGTHPITWKPNGRLASGVYWVVVKSDFGTRSVSVLKIP